MKLLNFLVRGETRVGAVSPRGVIDLAAAGLSSPMETLIAEGGAGDFPVLSRYQAAVERGWEEGIHLLRIIGANARYFTDGASKVALDALRHGQVVPDFDDAPVAYQDLARFVDSDLGIYYMSVFKK